MASHLLIYCKKKENKQCKKKIIKQTKQVLGAL